MFDARLKPHPGMRTCCAVDCDVDFYMPHRKDSTFNVYETTFPTLAERKLICGLPARWLLPPVEEHCVNVACCGKRKSVLPLVSVGLGNIVVAPQALQVLQLCELTTPLGSEGQRAAVPPAPRSRVARGVAAKRCAARGVATTSGNRRPPGTPSRAP